jgi:hypothetical protein
MKKMMEVVQSQTEARKMMAVDSKQLIVLFVQNCLLGCTAV